MPLITGISLCNHHHKHGTKPHPPNTLVLSLCVVVVRGMAGPVPLPIHLLKDIRGYDK